MAVYPNGVISGRVHGRKKTDVTLAATVRVVECGCRITERAVGLHGETATPAAVKGGIESPEDVTVVGRVLVKLDIFAFAENPGEITQHVDNEVEGGAAR